MQATLDKRLASQDWVLDPSLVLYLPLHQLDGSSFTSRDAYGHLCTVTGALWRPDGRYFDGVDDFIDCGNSPSFVYPANKRGVFLWMRGDVQGEQSVFTHWSDAGVLNQRGWRIMKDVDTDKFRVLMTDDGEWNTGHIKDYISSIVAVDNDWHQVGFTFDAGTLRLFVDGLEDPSPTKNRDSAITAIHSPTVGVLMGAASDPPRGFSEVDIGEALIYNRAPTLLEIQHNYLATKWRYR